MLITRRATLMAGAVAPLAAGAGSTAAAPSAGTVLNVQTMGAIGDGRVNDTAVLQRAIDTARGTPGGATVFLPAGTYAVDTLTLLTRGHDDFDRRIMLIGEGAGRSVLVPAGIGRVLLDASGCNNLTLSGLEIDSGRVPSAAALLLARRASSPNCANHIFHDLVLRGSYSVATVVAIGAETARWTDCTFSNGHTDPAHCCFLTGDDPVIARKLGRDALVRGPNTDNVMTGCSFYTPHDGAQPLRFVGSAGYAFFGCSILGGNARGVRLAAYAGPRDAIFNGPVAWHGCHFEVTGAASCVHWIDAPTGVTYWRNLAIHGGYAVVASGSALIDFDRSDPRRQPVLQRMLLSAPALPPGVSNVDVHSYAISGAAIDMLGTASAVVALGFVENSRIDADQLRTPQVVGRVMPVALQEDRRQTFARGMVVERIDAQAGRIEQWVVQVAGTTDAPSERTQSARPGEFITLAGRRHLVWHRTAEGRITLDLPTTGTGQGFAEPELRQVGIGTTSSTMP